MTGGVIRAAELPNKRYDDHAEDVFRLFPSTCCLDRAKECGLSLIFNGRDG